MHFFPNKPAFRFVEFGTVQMAFIGECSYLINGGILRC